ncbi:hypothetical protein [Burkholderia stagnalis]|uniref:hypothetical protein n=1 Tax=Burkholderia stagnalis TaxID=1503054 RepID=UPI0012DADAA2|nr:hypothetical protein [Burkholderia stagnalis]
MKEAHDDPLDGWCDSGDGYVIGRGASVAESTSDKAVHLKGLLEGLFDPVAGEPFLNKY